MKVIASIVINQKIKKSWSPPWSSRASLWWQWAALVTMCCVIPAPFWPFVWTDGVLFQIFCSCDQITRKYWLVSLRNCLSFYETQVPYGKQTALGHFPIFAGCGSWVCVYNALLAQPSFLHIHSPLYIMQTEILLIILWCIVMEEAFYLFFLHRMEVKLITWPVEEGLVEVLPHLERLPFSLTAWFMTSRNKELSH